MNSNNFIFNMIAAKRAKKDLEEKGVQVGKNFVFKHAILAGSAEDPSIANILLQNDVRKKDTSVAQISALKKKKDEVEKDNKDLVSNLSSRDNQISSIKKGLEQLFLELVKETSSKNPFGGDAKKWVKEKITEHINCLESLATKF